MPPVAQTPATGGYSGAPQPRQRGPGAEGKGQPWQTGRLASPDERVDETDRGGRRGRGGGGVQMRETGDVMHEMAVPCTCATSRLWLDGKYPKGCPYLVVDGHMLQFHILIGNQPWR